METGKERHHCCHGHSIWDDSLYAGTEEELHRLLVNVQHLGKKIPKLVAAPQTKCMSAICTSHLSYNEIKMLQEVKYQNTLISPFAPKPQYCLYYSRPSTDLSYNCESHLMG